MRPPKKYRRRIRSIVRDEHEADPTCRFIFLRTSRRCRRSLTFKKVRR